MSEVVLPEGWFTALLGDVCTKPQYGYTTRASDNGDVKFLRTTDITKNTLNWETVPFCEVNPDNVDKYRLYDRDIVISRAGSIGFSCLLKNPPDNAVFASYLIRFQPADLMNEIFLKRFLESSYYWEQLAEKAAGNAVQNVNAQKLANIELFLPPLAEQKVIAEKLDELLAQVDILKTRLTTIPTLLKRFRQSVLAAAVSGKLTEEWREAKGLEWKWRELLLSDITSSVTYGYTASSTQNEVGPRMLRITDIQDGRVDWDNVPYCEIDEDRKDTYLLQKGDLVFARTGATVGKSFLIRDTPPDAVFASYLIRVRCNVGNSIEYLSYFFQSNNYWRQITEFSAGIGQPNVNGTKLKNLAIPLPPLEEQTEIVRRVEQLFAYADQIEQQVKNAQNRVNNLTQSILDKAFRGELTADWRAANPHLISGENSAQALLAKIKAERDKPKKTSKQQAMFNE